MGISKKARYKKIVCWLLVDLAVAMVIFALLLYKPSRYEPLGVGPVGHKKGQVHRYLTYLASELYNGAQSDEPFELMVIENGINETIARWSAESEGIRFSAPAVLFVPESVVLMGTADIKGAEFVVTIVLEPKIDEKELLNLQVAKVKVGAMNITPLARMIAKRMYQQQIATIPIDTEDLRAQIAGSLLNDEPFEPVFLVEDKKVRLENVAIRHGKLILRFVPAL